jgi:acetylornithine/succinyldiaminopimelate/putrescine aminotransferase/predicted amino acid dehydrogenase
MTALNPDRQFLIGQLKYDRQIVRAKGHYLYDTQGRAGLDFMAQFGAVPFGHNPDDLWDVVRQVGANDEPSLIQPFVSPAAEALAEELIAASPIKKGHVTFANSGAETIEAAIKLARANTQRRTILATINGFHGKTLGAVSATGNRIYKDPFLVDTAHFDHVAYGDLDALAERLKRRDVAAFIVEPVQGEAGMITPPDGYLAAAAAACRSNGTLFVLDEVQTGLGRTGRLFAAEHDQLVPDILLLAKALGGGLVSLGACLCAEHVWTRDFGNYHSSTFANNHLACSIGLATLFRLRDDDEALVRDVARKGAHLRRGLDLLVRDYGDVFASVSGRGLMQGLELNSWNRYDSYFLTHASYVGLSTPLFCAHLLHEHDIVTAPTFNRNNVIRLQPSLTIEMSEIDRLLTALDVTAQLLRKGDLVRFFHFVTGKTRSLSVVQDSEAAAAGGAAAQAQPQPRRREDGKGCLGRFAFLIHYTELDDILFSGPPEFARLDSESKKCWFDWLQSWSRRRHDPGVACHVPVLNSATGGYVEGWLIAAPLMPRQMLRLSPREREQLISDYLAVTKDLGVDMLGLGAFTSIVTRNGIDVADRGLNVTTGNSLTACAAAESLKTVIREQGSDIAGIEIGVIGAAGSVGRLACLNLARQAGRLTLFGNPHNPGAVDKLRLVAAEIYREALLDHALGRTSPIGDAAAAVTREAFPAALLGDDTAESLVALHRHLEAAFAGRSRTAPIRITVDLSAHLAEMAAVVSATSQAQGSIDPALFARGAIVCDVARPPDISRRAGNRADVLIYEGALMRFPENVSFGRRNVIGAPPGINLACLAETVTLAMSGIRRNFSIGDRPPLADACDVYSLALEHGFTVAPLRAVARSKSAELSYAATPRAVSLASA